MALKMESIEQLIELLTSFLFDISAAALVGGRPRFFFLALAVWSSPFLSYQNYSLR